MYLVQNSVYDIESVNNINENVEKIIYNLHQPLDKKIMGVSEAYYSKKSVLVLVKHKNEVIGHVCCFYNEKKNQVEFGFFGQLDSTDIEVTDALFNEIIYFTRKTGVKRIIGPVNTPAVVYLYGFKNNDIHQQRYLDYFLSKKFQVRHLYRIYEVPILSKKNLVPPHGLTHIDSITGLEKESLKRELQTAIAKIIGAVVDDLIIPIELMDAIFYVVEKFGYPECIQMTRDENSEINGVAIMLPNMWPKYLANDGKSNELRIGSGGWVQEHSGKGYGMYHLYNFGNMCKKNKVKRLLIGQTDVSNVKALRLFEKFGCPLVQENTLLEMNL